MKTLRALIADDEELARQILREYLAGEPDIEIIGECPNGFEAVKAVNELRPDLLFLDVQMPKLDGFEVLELIDSSGDRRRLRHRLRPVRYARLRRRGGRLSA